jgi:UDP-N-acetylmuramate--alanine ligase
MRVDESDVLPASFARAHFVGVAGSGMKPVAAALLSCGVAVSGSDPGLAKGRPEELATATLHAEHHAANIAGADVVVYSSAIRADNPEIVAARAAGIPVVHRSVMLGWFLAQRESVLVGGTHGKTTTTAMVALLLRRLGASPWAFVGGTVREFGGNFLAGDGRYVVAESDESDGSFLLLPRAHAIVTNVEAEHLDYWGTPEAMRTGYMNFMRGIATDGRLVVCADDSGVCDVAAASGRAVVRYSAKGHPADFEASAIEARGTGSVYILRRAGLAVGRVALGVPGLQNVQNSLGAFAMVAALGYPIEQALDALAEFRGVDRRFTKYTMPSGCLVIDDYAHHPTEIRATVAAARLLASERGGRVVGVFQPHRYTRTRDFFDEFPGALAGLDELIVTEIYSAGEPPIPGVSGGSLAARIAEKSNISAEFCPDLEGAKKSVEGRVKNSDIVLLLGAGSVTRLANLLSCPAEA